MCLDVADKRDLRPRPLQATGRGAFEPPLLTERGQPSCVSRAITCRSALLLVPQRGSVEPRGTRRLKPARSRYLLRLLMLAWAGPQIVVPPEVTGLSVSYRAELGGGMTGVHIH
jgi:hypothetical protein